MVNSYQLAGLDPYAFENLINLLALKVLGAGASGFGPGSDGGRDGFFEGEAPYPSTVDRWKGVWYIQSKFHSPHLSKDSQKWLIKKIEDEIAAFKKEDSNRKWPDNWIIATNVDPSGEPDTGSFDVIRSLVADATDKTVNIAIWGGNKILGLLSQHPDVAHHYSHFITPGQVLASLQAQLADQYAPVSTVIRYLVATQFSEQIYTKLDQAGSSSDTRPGVHHLFIDLPFTMEGSEIEGAALAHLCRASAQPQRHSAVRDYPKAWRDWTNNPQRARVALLKGGPGQGKSTVGQYFSQIQRAALLLLPNAPTITDKIRNFALEVETAAKKIDAWPSAPRIPIFIELKEYAHWFGRRTTDEAHGVLSYLASRIGTRVEQEVLPSTLRRALALQSWFVLFDGLDEVPNDVKDAVADEVNNFVNEVIIQEDADVLTLCTSRPQGYSGQFSALDGPVLNLQKLSVEIAILCAEPVVRYDRSEDEGTRSLDLLKAAAASKSVQQLMTTPLQSHIMAVVVRDGGRPPERRWQLFENFYQVMKKRESLKNVHNPRISRLLREEDRLLRAVHTRLGFVLHARAERSDGAQTTLTKEEFRQLVTQVVEKLSEDDTQNMVDVVMEAMTERLVLVSTPENGAHVRFDIRQLQEFFAAEFLYDAVSPEILAHRIDLIGGDSHWLEVMHFLLSALVENRRTTELDVTVKVLERLNEGNLDGKHRLFYRRMGKGAILATRLLVEGVLEQDKRDRLRFRPLFDPLGGYFDLKVLKNLANVASPNSKTWLINLLREKISEANRTESLGALIALGWMLPDEHPNSTEVLQWFLSSSVAHQQIAISAWNTHGALYQFRAPEPLSFWVLAGAITIASGKQWSQLSTAGQKDIYGLLVTHPKHIVRACAAAGIEPKLANLFAATFDTEMDSGAGSTSYDLGPVSARLYQHNWATGSLPSQIAQALAECPGTKVLGLLQLILALLRFARNRDVDHLEQVLALIPQGREEVLAAVPKWLTAYIPCYGPHYLIPFDCTHLRGITSAVLKQLIENADFLEWPPLMEGLFLDESRGSDVSSWERFFKLMPFVAVGLFLEASHRYGFTAAQLKRGEALAKLTVLKSPDLAKRHFLSWGMFLQTDAKLLNQLNDLVKQSGCHVKDIVHGQPTIHPFPIDIRDDYSISLLAKGIVRCFDYSNDREWSETVKELSQAIRLFGLDASLLSAIALSGERSTVVRAACLLLSVVCADEISMKERLLSVLGNLSETLALISDDTAGWYVEGLCVLMEKELGENAPLAVSAAEALLAVARDKVEIRGSLSSMLFVWRETSSSPVTATQSMQKWLDE